MSDDLTITRAQVGELARKYDSVPGERPHLKALPFKYQGDEPRYAQYRRDEGPTYSNRQFLRIREDIANSEHRNKIELLKMQEDNLYRAEQTQLVQLAFKVPKGFEDVAWQDIKRFLPIEVSYAAIAQDHVKILSGTILLSVPVGDSLNVCLSKYAEGKLWSVIRVLLSMVSSNEKMEDMSVISEEILEGLEAERISLPSKRSRQIINPEASKGRNSRYRRRVAPLNIDSTPSEQTFLDRLEEIADSQSESHKLLYAIWKGVKGPQYLEDRKYLPQNFAIRFERGDFHFPSLKSSGVASHLGDLYGAQLMNMTVRSDLKADLTSPELEIMTELLHDEGRLYFLSGIALNAPTTPKHRLDRLRGRTTMLPERAYCLCLLHPLLKTPHTRNNAMVFLDPCSGFGSIPLEIAAIAQRNKLIVISLAADNEQPSLEKGIANALSSGMGSQAGLSGVQDGLLWSGRGFGHSGGFREAVIDGVVCDLPWGIKELTPKAVSALYPALLRFLGHATVDGGSGVFLCQRDRIFLGAVKSNDRMWEVSEHRVVDVEGVQAHAFVVKRKARAADKDVVMTSD